MFVVAGKGKWFLSKRVSTTRESLTRVLGSQSEAGVCVAVEASGATCWVHKHLLGIGVWDVYVVNPNKMRLIAENRKKTDKVDGLPERVHMSSDSFVGMPLHDPPLLRRYAGWSGMESRCEG